jgi:hypothetical protein
MLKEHTTPNAIKGASGSKFPRSFAGVSFIAGMQRGVWRVVPLRVRLHVLMAVDAESPACCVGSIVALRVKLYHALYIPKLAIIGGNNHISSQTFESLHTFMQKRR